MIQDNPRGRGPGWHSEPLYQDLFAQRLIEARPLGEAGLSPLTIESEDDDQNRCEEALVRGASASVEGDKGCIDVYFDLNDPKQAEKFEGHKVAFGQNYIKVEPLGDGRVALKIYPGGAKELR